MIRGRVVAALALTLCAVAVAATTRRFQCHDLGTPTVAEAVLPRGARPGAVANTLTWFVIGDFGKDAALGPLAEQMARVARRRPPDFIVSVGDNFYMKGLTDRDDPRFNTSWYTPFIGRHPELRVPWRVTPGNHDCYGDVMAQVELTDDAVRNPGGYWQMPALNYHWTEALGNESVLFIVMDTSQMATERAGRPDLRPHLEWASRVAATSTATWKVLVSHTMLLSTSNGGRRRVASAFRRQGIEAGLLDAHGIDAFFCGHDHVAQRHRTTGGTVHWLVGASKDNAPQSSGRPARVPRDWWFDHSRSTSFAVVQLRIGGPHGPASTLTVEYVAVSRGGARADQVDANATVLDSFTLRKARGGATASPLPSVDEEAAASATAQRSANGRLTDRVEVHESPGRAWCGNVVVFVMVMSAAGTAVIFLRKHRRPLR